MMKLKEGARFFDDTPADPAAEESDPTLEAIHKLAQAVQEMASKPTPGLDFAPIAELIAQIQDQQQQIIKCLKEPQAKKCWSFQVQKQSNGNMTIEAKEK